MMRDYVEAESGYVCDSEAIFSDNGDFSEVNLLLLQGRYAEYQDEWYLHEDSGK